MSAPQEDYDEIQIALLSSQLRDTIEEALEQEPMDEQRNSDGIDEEQLKDNELRPIILYLRDGTLPEETVCVLVPQQLREKVTQDHHDGQLAGHFSGSRLYKNVGGGQKCIQM